MPHLYYFYTTDYYTYLFTQLYLSAIVYCSIDLIYQWSCLWFIFPFHLSYNCHVASCLSGRKRHANTDNAQNRKPPLPPPLATYACVQAGGSVGSESRGWMCLQANLHLPHNTIYNRMVNMQAG